MYVKQKRARLIQDINQVRSWFKTRSGRHVRFRLISHNDKDLLVEFFHHLSVETKRRRFHYPVDQLDDVFIEGQSHRFVAVDNLTNGGAVLALIKENGADRIVGVARLMRPDGQPDAPEAEAAIVVRDDFHGDGLGTELLRRMVLLARQMKLSSFLAVVEADNYPAIKLFRELDLPTESTTSHAETEMHIAVPQ